MLKTWTTTEGHLQTEVSNKLAEWLEDGLKEWDISRDAPYLVFRLKQQRLHFLILWGSRLLRTLHSYHHIVLWHHISGNRL
jgi:methionyl-tRNA synthetase